MENIDSIIEQVENLKNESSVLAKTVQNYSEDALVEDISLFLFNNWDGFDTLSDAVKFVNSINFHFNFIAKDCYFLSNDCTDHLFSLSIKYKKLFDVKDCKTKEDFEAYIKFSDKSQEILRLNNKFTVAETHNHDKSLKLILNAISNEHDLSKIKIKNFEKINKCWDEISHKNALFKYTEYRGLNVSCGSSYADINWRLCPSRVMYSLNEQGRSQVSEIISAFIGYKIKYFELLQKNSLEAMISEYLSDISLFDADNINSLAIKTHPLYKNS